MKQKDAIVFVLGDESESGAYPLLFTVPICKSWYNRLRFWLFFKFFPFKFKEWKRL